MDVRCSRCGVEYEFDDEKVSPTGVTVKCTSCGHVFKVKRPSPEESAPFAIAPSGEWMVRHRDGTVMRFKELTTLQKWIVEQKVSSDDEISRTGRSWRPLGDIAELASFFEVVNAANAARASQTSSPPRTPPVKSPVALSDLSGPVPRTPPPEEGRRPQAPTPPPSPASPQALAVTPVPPEAEMEFYGSDLEQLDEEDPVASWRRRARRRNAALIVLAVLVVGGASLFLLARPTFDAMVAKTRSLTGDQAAPVLEESQPDALVQRADAHLRAALPTDPALFRELTEKAALADASPWHVAVLSRLHAHAALRATLLSHLLEEKKRRAGADVDEAIAARRKQADDELASAYSLASRARTAAPESSEADLAFATYQAVKGALAEAQADLDAARKHAPEGDARVAHEATVLAAVAAVVAAGDEDAREQARLALRSAGDVVNGDARLWMASVVLDAIRGSGDDAAAMAALASWQERHPDDEWVPLALALLQKAGEGAPVASGAGAASTSAPTSAPPTASDAAPATESDDEEGDTGELDYDTVVKRADKNRLRERTSTALKLYKQAAQLRPQAAKPHVGMGWCYLDLDKTRAAVDAFAHALTLDSKLAEAHFGLAESQRYSGQKAAAVRSYKRYLKLAPSGPDAPVAKNAIQSLAKEN